MRWTDDFLRRCLSDIPRGAYRNRLRSELEDHLTLLESALLESGHSQQDARIKALNQLGDPALLNASYQDAWLEQPERTRHDFLLLFQGGLLAGLCYGIAIVVLALLGFGYDGNHFPIIGHPGRCAFFGGVIFLSAILADAFFLHRSFHWRSNSRRLITTGLLLTWTGEKAIILFFSAMIYGTSPLSLPQLLHQIAHGGDQTAPWFTLPYIIFSLVGCFLLGWLFGTKHAHTSSPSPA